MVTICLIIIISDGRNSNVQEETVRITHFVYTHIRLCPCLQVVPDRLDFHKINTLQRTENIKLHILVFTKRQISRYKRTKTHDDQL